MQSLFWAKYNKEALSPPSPWTCFTHTCIYIFLQKISLAEQLYIADNLAFFPYQTQDEPLFIINQIDIIVSVSGSNILQSFKEVLSTPQCWRLSSLYYNKDKCCVHRCDFGFFVTFSPIFYCIFLFHSSVYVCLKEKPKAWYPFYFTFVLTFHLVFNYLMVFLFFFGFFFKLDVNYLWIMLLYIYDTSEKLLSTHCEIS